MSLVFISSLSNFSVVSVGFNLPARQIASNPRTSLSELFAFCQIFFFPGNAAICGWQRNPTCFTVHLHWADTYFLV